VAERNILVLLDSIPLSLDSISHNITNADDLMIVYFEIIMNFKNLKLASCTSFVFTDAIPFSQVALVL